MVGSSLLNVLYPDDANAVSYSEENHVNGNAVNVLDEIASALLNREMEELSHQRIVEPKYLPR